MEKDDSQGVTEDKNKQAEEDDRLEQQLDQIVGRFLHLCSRLNSTFHLKEKFDMLQGFVWDHPFITLILTITLMLCSVPLMMFVFFAAGTMFAVFFGFMFIEGTLVTIGSIIFIGVLIVSGFISLGFAGVIILAYFGCNFGFRFINGVKEKYFGKGKGPVNVSFDKANETMNGHMKNLDGYLDKMD
ncbi:unnamed protein product [Owenia fusiformis]|uniref:Uncharacterized protein n=1 Tax=Owenia fusiformis TaxID=6347 RepID=A0A8J1U5S5_OWEFU|nr:unnamed protein product [Owenia fusiformis]